MTRPPPAAARPAAEPSHGRRQTWPEGPKLAIVAAMPAPTRSSAPSSDSCTVCGSRDARTLSTTALASGEMIVVCGSHAVAHARAEAPARTATELRAMLADRRDRTDRRNAYKGETDELALALTTAFTRERRGAERRNADT